MTENTDSWNWFETIDSLQLHFGRLDGWPIEQRLLQLVILFARPISERKRLSIYWIPETVISYLESQQLLVVTVCFSLLPNDR